MEKDSTSEFTNFYSINTWMKQLLTRKRNILPVVNNLNIWNKTSRVNILVKDSTLPNLNRVKPMMLELPPIQEG